MHFPSVRTTTAPRGLHDACLTKPHRKQHLTFFTFMNWFDRKLLQEIATNQTHFLKRCRKQPTNYDTVKNWLIIRKLYNSDISRGRIIRDVSVSLEPKVINNLCHIRLNIKHIQNIVTDLLIFQTHEVYFCAIGSY